MPKTKEPETNYVLAVPPELAELKSRPCSLDELQAALVRLIDLHNEQGRRLAEAINGKQTREWRAIL